MPAAAEANNVGVVCHWLLRCRDPAGSPEPGAAAKRREKSEPLHAVVAASAAVSRSPGIHPSWP